MKIRKILAIIAVIAVVVSLASCKKSRFCHCISDSYTTVALNGDTVVVADTTVVNVDRGFKCDHIVEMGFQKLQDGEYVTATRKVDCKELDVENVTTIPQQHPTE